MILNIFLPSCILCPIWRQPHLKFTKIFGVQKIRVLSLSSTDDRYHPSMTAWWRFTLLATLALCLMNTLSFPNKFWRSPNLGIIILDSFVVSVGPIYIDRACHKRLHHCPLHRSLQTRLLQLSVSDNPPQQIQNSLALAVAKAPKSCHITHILRSLHWLNMTERVECKLLSLTKVFCNQRTSICT